MSVLKQSGRRETGAVGGNEMGILHKATGVFEERGDTDWFRMKLVAGQTYQINGPANALLNVVLPNGEVMTLPLPFSNYAHFVAPVSGDYFLSANSLGTTGFYSLTVEDVPDPHPSAVTTPDSLAVGGTVTVTDNPNSVSFDDDWFAIDVVAGQSYVLSTSAANGRVYVVDGAGEVIAIEGNVGQGGTLVHFTATETGRLYAGAQHPGGSTYTLSLQAVADDHGETAASAGSMTIGTPVNGVWETKGDDDAYAVTLSAGSSYSFAVEAQGDITQRGFVRILDQSGAEVWNSLGQANEQTTLFSPEADGTYYVIAGGELSGSDSIGSWNYTLTSALVANDLTDNILTTGTLAVGGQVASAFDTPGDRDWFKVDLVQGQSYLFTMNAQNPQDSRLALYDAQGHLVHSASDATFGPQLHHTAETTGTYFVAALPGQQPGTFTLSAETVVDDFADNSSTTGVAVNGVVSGTLEVNNDVDWFAVDLVGGRTYSLQGPFAVFDAQGNALTQINWGDASFTAAASGTYYLAVSGSAGDYEYGIVQISDDFLESADTTGVMRQEVSGTAGPDTFVSTDRYEYFMGLGGDDLFIAGTGYDRFEGGAGIDTLSYAGSSVGMEVNLLLSRSQINGLFDDVIVGVENIIGSALADSITGNGLANRLEGGAGIDVLRGSGGNDTLDGGTGADQLDGGSGNDVLYVDNASDIVVEAAGGGSDRVFAGVSYALAAAAEVELMTTTNYTSTAALNLTGSGTANTILANDGVNILDGKGGADTLIGRLGNDFYYVDNAGDRVVEAAGEGSDRVFASASWTLGAGVSVELLTTDFAPGTAAINLTGNELANTIQGNAGVNVLDGKAGADTLVGLGGNDLYYVDNVADRTIEAAGDGTDRVFASISYALAASVSVETLSTSNNTGTAAINLTGNELAQTIFGNDGANVLDGKAGADTLVGQLGNDFYYVDNAADRVVEAAGQGSDRIFASTSYTLGASVSVELMGTTSNAGTDAINLTGNELVNVLQGNAGSNSLDGKAGADTMIGLAGDDFYHVDNAADRVVEAASEGNDQVFTSVSYTLAAGQSVETLSANAGTAAINLTGNELANRLEGNDGANVLDGKAGGDGLFGGGGADSFVFSSALNSGIDFFLDFISGTDKILLDHNIFTGLPLGQLAGAFFSDGAPNNANPCILYNPGFGFIGFDADGTGPGGGINFALLQPGGTVTASDFFVI